MTSEVVSYLVFSENRVHQLQAIRTYTNGIFIYAFMYLACLFIYFKLFIYLFIYWLPWVIFFKNKFIYLFIYFWLSWIFVASRGLSLVAASGGYSSLWCAGFSLQWPLLLWSMGSRHAGFSSRGSWALECRLSSCGTQA